MPRLRLLLLLLAALALGCPVAAAADERILHFLSDVAVERDGALLVTETIRLRAEGQEIRRGIQRDFPTRYRTADGRQVRVGFEVGEVSRDGDPEPFTTTPHGNGVRVRIGRADLLLPDGEHVYSIRYRTTRQLGFFPGFDELYWNATGNGWTLPIDGAEARIRLPAPVAFGRRAVYTGPEGSRAANAEVASESPGEILFRTTAPLAAGEGLTVAVSWPKGVVVPPAAETKARWWLQDNGPIGVGLLGLMGVLAYYFHAWRRAGRGPRAGTVVPIFSPPDGLSPASMRYVTEMGSDNRTFAAALIDLAVRGRLRLREGEKHLLSRPKTTLEKTGGTAQLPPPEAAMLEKLFAGEDSILMDDENHATFSAAQTALSGGLKKQHEGSLFVRNWSWSVRGLLTMLGAVYLTAAALVLASPEDFAGTGGLKVAVAGLIALAAAAILYRGSRGSGTAASMLGRIMALLLALGAAGAGYATIGAALEGGRIVPLLIPLASLPFVVSAFWWMAAPTAEGRRVLDRIAGFRQYLSITEEERLEAMHPPEKTPELFERYLPYAIALKVENAWAERFAGVLAAAAAGGNTQPFGWYSGHSDPWSHPGGFADRVGSSLASTISSASTAPGSSSGSSGGGSSGGGGGGGGGSGW